MGKKRYISFRADEETDTKIENVQMMFDFDSRSDAIRKIIESYPMSGKDMSTVAKGALTEEYVYRTLKLLGHRDVENLPHTGQFDIRDGTGFIEVRSVWSDSTNSINPRLSADYNVFIIISGGELFPFVFSKNEIKKDSYCIDTLFRKHGDKLFAWYKIDPYKKHRHRKRLFRWRK